MSDWAKDWNYCRKCFTTKTKHVLDGYCKVCYAIVSEAQEPKSTLRYCSGITPSGQHCNKPFSSKGSANRRCVDCLRREKDNNEIDRSHKVGLSI